MPRQSFQDLYARVEERTRRSLETFREQHPPQHIEIDGVIWEYLATGRGGETVLFLHGMTGAYDIWWQQIEALESRCRVIALTYPAVNSLRELARGVLAILAREQARKVNVIGTSLGGYLAQYLMANHAGYIERVCLGNTFPPNDLIARKNRVVGTLLPYLPEQMVLSTVRKSFVNSIYPAAGHSEIVLAFLMELSYGRMSKAQFIPRYRCVIDPFSAPVPQALGIPVMIVESDNDPLVEVSLREQLKATYPSAIVHTLHHAGHFPYLNEPALYTQFLEELLSL